MEKFLGVSSTGSMGCQMVRVRKMISPPLRRDYMPDSQPRRDPGDDDDREPKRPRPRGFMKKISSWMENRGRSKHKYLSMSWAEVGTMGSPLQVGAWLTLADPLHHLTPMSLGKRRNPSSSCGKQKGRLPLAQLLKGESSLRLQLNSRCFMMNTPLMSRAEPPMQISLSLSLLSSSQMSNRLSTMLQM
jgi:hypothetical protein